ncbi:unnamed protein product [Vicia faba]|uniref:Uncharacterized protein n=1 Tax=Vicia faba TaxID=3906 RepID=A0AAV0ZRT5_VICFA|nr:unnamed protein product [Vicia faba]
MLQGVTLISDMTNDLTCERFLFLSLPAPLSLLLLLSSLFLFFLWNLLCLKSGEIGIDFESFNQCRCWSEIIYTTCYWCFEGYNELSTMEKIIVAATIGAATTISTNPSWVVTTRLQTQRMWLNVVPYESVLSALTKITREKGLRGLYNGIVPSLAGVSHVVIQFLTYEKIKSYIAKKDNNF